jgi:hypothetical protein
LGKISTPVELTKTIKHFLALLKRAVENSPPNFAGPKEFLSAPWQYYAAVA